jgi:hypothetical protein
MLLTYLPLLIAGLVGAVRAFRKGFPHWLCWMPAIYLTALHMLFVSSIRYRIPAMVLLIIPAAATLHSIGTLVYNHYGKKPRNTAEPSPTSASPPEPS